MTMYNINVNCINCTCDKAGQQYEGDTYLEVLFIADEGYEFKTPQRIKYGVITTQTYLIDNKTMAFRMNNCRGDIKGTIEATEIVEGDVFKFTNLYVITDEMLSKLAKKTFINDKPEIVSLSNYIYNLYRLPFKLTPKSKDQDIVLSNTTASGVVAKPIGSDYNIKLGTIKVPEKYQNVYDYKNVSATIHLPFTNPIDLPIEYVVNQTVSVEYQIDLYNYLATINISSSLTNSVVKSEIIEIGSKIPFLSKVDNNPSIKEVKKLVDNKVRTPSIVITRNIPYDNGVGDYGKEVKEWCKIGDKTGYVKFSDVMLKTTATEQEDAIIKNLLLSGVFV